MEIHRYTDSLLSQVIHTLREPGSLLALAQRWQQHARQNADNANDHQQLDQRKTRSVKKPLLGWMLLS
jgi:hypothetical protein